MNNAVKLGVFLSIWTVLKPATLFSQEANTQNIFGDWKIICEAAECRMAQSVLLAERETVIVEAKIFQSEEPVLLLSFPWGILLSPGLTLSIDGKKRQTLPFEICNPSGCHVGLPIRSELLIALKRGNDLQLTFYDAAKSPVAPKISLTGFTAAYEALQ